ncbi:MAG: hypothetical protein GNW80_08190, partial [Asgard group archaeon]|nr:hypothetical protein [Asgard group archaeon]
EIAIEISKKRYREAEAVGAEIILTFCPTCELTLGRGADTIARDEMDFDEDDFDFDAEPDPKIKVMNLLQWLVTLKK